MSLQKIDIRLVLSIHPLNKPQIGLYIQMIVTGVTNVFVLTVGLTIPCNILIILSTLNSWCIGYITFSRLKALLTPRAYWSLCHILGYGINVASLTSLPTCKFSLAIGPDYSIQNVVVRGSPSSTQWACYLPSLNGYPFIHLGREEQARGALFKDTTHRRTQGSNSRPWDHEFGNLVLSYASLYRVLVVNILRDWIQWTKPKISSSKKKQNKTKQKQKQKQTKKTGFRQDTLCLWVFGTGYQLVLSHKSKKARANTVPSKKNCKDICSLKNYIFWTT